MVKFFKRTGSVSIEQARLQTNPSVPVSCGECRFIAVRESASPPPREGGRGAFSAPNFQLRPVRSAVFHRWRPPEPVPFRRSHASATPIFRRPVRSAPRVRLSGLRARSSGLLQMSCRLARPWAPPPGKTHQHRMHPRVPSIW